MDKLHSAGVLEDQHSLQPTHQPKEDQGTAKGIPLWQQSRGWLLAKTNALLNYGLDETSSIGLRTGWPLLLLPVALVNQLLAPHPVWVVLFIVIAGIYGIGYAWLRHQRGHVTLSRAREGEAVAAGDPLIERFELRNESLVPVLWAAVEDYSDMPDYNAGRVVACGSGTGYRWQTDATCGQRGIFRLGPSSIQWGDPFGLFSAQTHFPSSEQIVIYPRIAHLPEFHLPYGSLGGARQLQHPLIGSIRSASVRLYQPGDSLRHVHWPATARHRNLMVTELDAEHGGEVWIVVDLNASAQMGEGEESTLEYGIVVAASLAAQLINSNERLAVGLLLAADVAPASAGDSTSTGDSIGRRDALRTITHQHDLQHDGPYGHQGFQAIVPQSGQAQFWQIMGALATAQAVPIPLYQLLQSSRSMVTSRQSLIVITPDIAPDSSAGSSRIRHISTQQGGNPQTPIQEDIDDGATDQTADTSYSPPPTSAEAGGAAAPTDDAGLTNGAAGHDWLDELVQSRLRQRNSVILVQHSEQVASEQVASEQVAGEQVADGGSTSTLDDEAAQLTEQRQHLLAQHEIGCTVLQTSDRLASIMTRTRVRKEVRTTPMGGAITIEIEEEMA